MVRKRARSQRFPKHVKTNYDCSDMCMTCVTLCMTTVLSHKRLLTFPFTDDETLLPKRPNELETRVVCPTDSFSDIFRDVVTLRPAASEIPNFLKGLQMNNNYLESEFSKWKGMVIASHFYVYFKPSFLKACNAEWVVKLTAF